MTVATGNLKTGVVISDFSDSDSSDSDSIDFDSSGSVSVCRGTNSFIGREVLFIILLLTI